MSNMARAVFNITHIQKEILEYLSGQRGVPKSELFRRGLDMLIDSELNGGSDPSDPYGERVFLRDLRAEIPDGCPVANAIDEGAETEQIAKVAKADGYKVIYDHLTSIAERKRIADRYK